MVAILEFDINANAWIDHRNGTAPQAAAPAVPSGAQLWKAAVLAVAADAKAALRSSHGRIDAAVAIVLAGDAELTGEHTGRVASQSDEGTVYTLCNGECECRDFPRAPESWCKHRLAVAILRRATQRAKTEAKALDAPAAAPKQPAATQPVASSVGLPEAPASANAYVTIGGRQWQITLRDTDEDRLIARMERLMARYPVPEAPARELQAPAAPVAEAPVLHTPPPAESWCGLHGLYMQWHDPKPGDTKPGWWSHKIDGAWCRGRVPGSKK